MATVASNAPAMPAPGVGTPDPFAAFGGAPGGGSPGAPNAGAPSSGFNPEFFQPDGPGPSINPANTPYFNGAAAPVDAAAPFGQEGEPGLGGGSTGVQLNRIGIDPFSARGNMNPPSPAAVAFRRVKATGQGPGTSGISGAQDAIA